MPRPLSTAAPLAALAAATLLATLLGAPSAMAGPEIGQVKQTTGDARILRGGAVLAAKPGLALQQADVIETGASGAIGMTFTDNSRMALGPDSRLALETYRYAPGGATNAFDARLSAGSLTAASGQIAARPDAMRVLMPTTVLGVRGTEFAVRVQ